MTVELLKKSFKYRQIVAQSTTVHEETAEAIVPDAFPDIERIVDTSALVFIREKEAQTDQADLRCSVRMTVLYIPEGENRLCRLEVPLSFAHRVELRGAKPGSDIACAARPVALDCRVLNPRKVSVKAAVGLDTRVFGDAETELTTGIAGEGTDSFQILRRGAVSSHCTVTAQKNFTLVEELEAPADAPAVKEILKNEVEVALEESRQMAGKSMLRGHATVHCLYEDADGEHARMSLDVPFSQIVDAPGADAEMTGKASFELRSFELSPSVDMAGDVKYLTLSLGLGVCLELYAEREDEVLSDIYSLTNTTKPEITQQVFARRGTESARQAAVSERIEAGMRVKKVLDWTVRTDTNADYVSGEPNVTFNTSLTVLYIGDENGVFSLSRRIPVTVELPDYKPGSVRVSVRDVHVAPDAEGNVDARYTLSVSREEAQSTSLPMVTGVEVGSPHAANGEKLSAVLRFTDEDDDLWSVAKCYHTTMAEIQTANRLEPSAPLERGKLLLIPLKR